MIPKTRCRMGRILENASVATYHSEPRRRRGIWAGRSEPPPRFLAVFAARNDRLPNGQFDADAQAGIEVLRRDCPAVLFYCLPCNSKAEAGSGGLGRKIGV